MVKHYTISISEISEDGITQCATWLTEPVIALAIRTGLSTRYGPADTEQVFSAQAITEAIESIPIVTL